MSAVEQDKPLTAIAEYNATAAALADLEHRYKGVVFDVATRDGMATAIKGRAELRGYRVALEKKRVEIKAPALERTRLIDSEAKRISAALSALEDPIDEVIQAEQTRKEREAEERRKAEEARQRAERERLEEEARALAEKQRQAQEREAAAQREIERQRAELANGNELLAMFVQKFGKRREFAKVVAAINVHLELNAKAAA